MGIFQGDTLVKTAIELMIDDIRKNPWLIDDIFSDLLDHPLLAKKYGQKEIDRAKDWFIKNNIHLYMEGQVDNRQFPCIIIGLGASPEDENYRRLDDGSSSTQEFTPSQIGKPISYIISPFVITSYDKETGIIEIPTSIEGYSSIQPGMIVVDPRTGAGFVVVEKAGSNGIKIAPNSKLTTSKIGIVPQYQKYKAKIGMATSNEVFRIGMHVSGDPSGLIFLYSVIKYGFYRYKESLFERYGFQQTKISCSDQMKDTMAENIYTRFITLSGLVEDTWIKTPHRYIENIELADPEEEGHLKTGITILSDAAPETVQDEGENLWITEDDEEE